MSQYFIISKQIKIVEQSTKYTCAAAVIQMVLSYFKINKKEMDIYKAMGEAPKEGVTIAELKKYLKSHKITTKSVLKSKIKKQKLTLSSYFDKTKKPIIVSTNDHVMLCIGYFVDLSDGLKYIIIDPAFGYLKFFNEDDLIKISEEFIMVIKHG